MELQEVQTLVSKLDIPTYKQDLTKDCTVLWLIANLRARNGNSLHFFPIMHWLLDEAERRHLLKRKVLEQHREALTIKAVKRDTPVPSVVSDTTAGVEPRLHDYQQAFVDKMRGGMRKGELFVVGSGVGKSMSHRGNPKLDSKP